MPLNAKYKARYEFGASYHIFNRTSAKQLMFHDTGNHFFFLEKFKQYLGNYVELLSKCLIPNHFHFLIRVKEFENMPPLPANKDLHTVITRQFKNFFISYSMSVKKKYELSGNVFAQKYKHIRLYTEKEIRRVILYIHRNPKHHGVGEWETYRWSSYNDVLMSREDDPKTAFILDLFGGKEAYIQAHITYVGQSSEPL